MDTQKNAFPRDAHIGQQEGAGISHKVGDFVKTAHGRTSQWVEGLRQVKDEIITTTRALSDSPERISQDVAPRISTVENEVPTAWASNANAAPRGFAIENEGAPASIRAGKQAGSDTGCFGIGMEEADR